MYSEELARKVLNAIYDSERSGRASITDAQRLSEQLGVDVHDIQDAFDILESEGRLRLHRVGDAGSIFRVELTGRGKKEILQPDSAGSGAEIPQPSTAVTSQPWRSEKEEPTTGRQYSLTCQREQARKMIFDRIEYGRELLRGLIPSISNTSELEEERQSYRKWSEYNAELLRRIFDDPSIAGQYSSIIRPIRRWEC